MCKFIVLYLICSVYGNFLPKNFKTKTKSNFKSQMAINTKCDIPEKYNEKVL